MSGEFLTKDWTHGQTNALVKNLGEEKARRIQRGDKFTLIFDDENRVVIKNTTSGLVIPDQRFSLPKTFQLTVPADYAHQTQLARFSDKYRSDFAYYNNEITDKNFAKVSHQLVPGKTYAVHIIGIKSGQAVSSSDCLKVYRTLGAYYTGAQGLSLARELKKEEFLVGKWLASFDQKNKLWKDENGSCRVPRDRSSEDYWSFDLGFFESVLHDIHCLLCLCDL